MVTLLIERISGVDWVPYLTTKYNNKYHIYEILDVLVPIPYNQVVVVMIWCCLWYSRNTKNFQKYIFYLWYILNSIWCEYFYNSTMTQACGRCCEPRKVVQVRALQVQMSTQGGIYTKYNLQEQSKPDLRMERPDQQTSKPSSLILRFLHQNIHAATIFPLKSFLDVILIKSNCRTHRVPTYPWYFRLLLLLGR